MTKAEKIKQAWAETGCTIVSSELTDSGFIDREFVAGEIDPEAFDVKFFTYVRPKSLRGIENNNGWTKIESESDLPDGDGLYIPCENGVPREEYCVPAKTIKSGYIVGVITHYKPIEKSEPPLY